MQEQQGETHRLNGRSDPVGPFGNPDGSRAPVVAGLALLAARRANRRAQVRPAA
jgi:hypothetical protein